MDKYREEARNTYSEWMKREYPALLENQGETLKMCMGFAENGFVSGWQHQQAKVEEANAKAQMCRDEKNHAINRWSVVCKERDELQKRVDKAIEAINEHYDSDGMSGLYFMDLKEILEGEQALKGEG